MNLGDGLLFELENGKPKLILLSHGVERNPAKGSFRPKATGVLSARQPSCVDEAPAEERPHRHLLARSKAGGGGGGGGGGGSNAPSTVRRSIAGTSKTQQHHKPGAAKTAVKLKSDKLTSSTGPLRANGKPPRSSRKAGPQDAPANQEAALKNSVVCLTNEQLQHLLSTVQTSSNGLRTPEEGGGQGGRTEGTAETVETEGPGLTGSQSGVKSAGGSEDAKDDRGHRSVSPDGSDGKEKRLSGCLFSWMEERRSDSRAAVDAKKAQWRKELDEQVAQKQQQQRSAPERLQAEEDADSVLSAQSSRGLREPPAAIRSSLRLGEVTPVEEALSAARREEQRRRWLEELDHQREETSRRRRQEKLQQSQAEDLQLWAAHFDSMQRRPQPAPPPAASAPPPAQYGGEWEPSSSLSLVWEAESVGGASVGGASVDVTGGYTARNSYLRTMTSLLDPAQVEERERRRLKQLEQQRAIEAQMEERRLQRQQEEARRRREEEEEDRRVALEREALQRQFELDAQKERMKTVQMEKDQEDGRLQDTEEKQQAEASKDGRRSTCSYRDTAVQTEGVQTPDASSVQCEPPPAPPSSAPPPAPPPPPPPHSRSRAARTGKENICVAAGGDAYEPFARTERSRRDKRRPEWNTQRPSRQFVPASARYPAALQRNRQESRLRRQAELLALQERTCVSRSDAAPPPAAPPPPPAASRGQSQPGASSSDRGRSPPVPAVRHRVQSQQASSCSSPPPPPPPPAAPPVLEFVPYVRTDEVFNMDPLEPADTPPPRTGAPPSPQSSAPPPAPPTQRDPLLHTELLRQTHTHRQQEILRGLAQLRQGLLQKQKELETDLNMRRHDNEHWSPPTTQHI